MPNVQTIVGDAEITGSLTVRGAITGNINRDNLTTEFYRDIELPLTQWRIWDAQQTTLTTAGSDDLGLTTGTFGTSANYITSGDLNAIGAITRRARIYREMCHEYVAGQNFLFSCFAGMLTSVASVVATLDVEIYVVGEDTSLASADLVVTSAQSINSLTFNNIAFVVNGTSVGPQDVLDIRMTLAANSATASSHFAAITNTAIKVPARG